MLSPSLLGCCQAQPNFNGAELVSIKIPQKAGRPANYLKYYFIASNLIIKNKGFSFYKVTSKHSFFYPAHHPKIALLDCTGPKMTEKCSLATVLHCTLLQITTVVCIVAIDNFYSHYYF